MPPLFPADPGVVLATSEPRAPSEEFAPVSAEPRSIEVPPVRPSQPAAVGVAVADIPARLVSGNGVLVETDGLDYRLGIDIAGLQIAEGQPADQWVPVWAVGRPVDEIVRAPVNVLRQDAPSDNTVYGRYNGTWAHLTVAWVDITGIPATFPPSPHTHPESDVVGLVADLALKAPLASPALTGVPTVPTAALGTNTTQAASTAFTFAGLALKADLASPALTGNPTAPTQGAGDSSTKLATTAFVTAVDILKAPLASPALTGTPTVPTAAPGTNTTQAASTAFVAAADALKADLASPALTGTPTAPTAAPGVSTTQLATTAFVAAIGGLKADLASPTFTGDPKAPTPATGDNDTSIATTAFVKAQAYATLASPVLTGDPQAPTATAGDSDTSVATTAFVTGGIATSAALKVAKAGDTMTGELILPAGVAGAGSVRVPHGIAPTTPVNGDMWTTSAGLYVRAGGFTTGPLGPSTGLGGLSTGEYTYFAGVAPPASGQVRMNNADPALATALYLHYQNAVSVDIANALRLIDTGTRILVQDKDDSTKYEYYLTTAAAVDNATYFTLAVTRTSGAATPPATNSRVMVCVFGLGVTGYLPVSGGTMVGKLTTVASATGTAGFNLPQGVAPSAPVNGDAWTTATALFVRINGATLTLATNVDLALKANLSGGNTLAGLQALDTTPTFPTATAGDNSTKGATTAFVTAAVSGGGSFLPITGGTLTGPLTMGTSQPIYQTGAAGTDRVHGWQTAGVIRWAMYANLTAEGGANAGSDFGLNAYTDAGAYLSTPFSIKRSTGVMTFNAAPFFAGGVSGGQGGTIDIAKGVSGTTLAGTAVRIDVNANSLRIYENASGFRGCTLDLTGCGAQSSFWHSGNFNPASYQPALGYVPVRNYASSINYLGWDGTGVALQTDSTFWGYVVYTAGGVAAIPRVSCGVADGRGISCVGVGGTTSLTVFGEMTSGSYAASFIPMDAARGASTAFNFLRTRSATAGTADTEHNLRGDGACLSDIAAAIPADYAELFEWADGNPGGETRVGLTVVLDGDKIRPSTSADDPRDILGVISAEPGFLGNSHWSRWQGKYLRDEYGRTRREWQDLVYWGRGEGQRRVKRRDQLTKRDWDAFTAEDDVEEVRDFAKLLNPDFDPTLEYVPRSDRPEWDPVGLLGQIPVRDGQVTGDRWRKMREMGPGIAMWMVR